MAVAAAATPPPAKQFTELTDYIYPPLNDLDFANPSTNFRVCVLTVLTSIFVYLITQLLFTLTSSLYQNMRLKERVFWNLAVVRSCFGLFCTVVGLWAFFADTALNRDVVFATSPTSHMVIAIAVGFFVFECAALTLSDICFNSFSAMLQVHHWLSLLGYCLVLVSGAGHTFGCKGLLLGMSTPFSCLCWTLLKAGQERSLLWKANQFLLVHTFHLRNVVELSIWGLTYRHWDHLWAHMPGPIFITMYLQLTLVTFFMTPFWTWKKTRQMIFPVDWNFEAALARKGKAVHHDNNKNNNNNKAPLSPTAEANNGDGLLYELLEVGNGYAHLNGGVGVYGIKED